MPSSPERLTLEANGLRFAALADGPRSGPLVLLLHGFPELSRSWRHQLPALAAAGYRAVAPDLRGYGETEWRGPYDTRTLAVDVRSLIEALGVHKAVLVGHDWGGAVAYSAAMFEPQVVDRLVVLNCPHPVALARTFRRSPRQLARSWYMFFFQLPRVPEWFLSRDGASPIARALRGGLYVREAWSRAELAHYCEAFARPGALTGPIGYYRAAFRSILELRSQAQHRIGARTLLLWGEEDRFLGKDLLEPSLLAPLWESDRAPEVRWVPGAGHFVQNEAPEQVNAALLDWLGSAS